MRGFVPKQACPDACIRVSRLLLRQKVQSFGRHDECLLLIQSDIPRGADCGCCLPNLRAVLMGTSGWRVNEEQRVGRSARCFVEVGDVGRERGVVASSELCDPLNRSCD